MSPSRCQVGCRTHGRPLVYKGCAVAMLMVLFSACRCITAAAGHRRRSCRHPRPVLPCGPSREDLVRWACPQSLGDRGLWAHIYEGLSSKEPHFPSTSCPILCHIGVAVQAYLSTDKRSESLRETVKHSAPSLCLQVDTPGRTLGFWHEFKIHPNRPDWILAKVRRSVCEEWDASTNPWCAYDLFVSQVGLLIGSEHIQFPTPPLLRTL